VSTAPVANPEPSQETVAYTSEKPQDLNRQILVPGQEMVVEKREMTYKINPIDVRQADAWKEGRLNFYLQPLPKVIDEINRYLEDKIYIEDQRLKDIKISINFNIAHREHFLSTLEKALPIESQTTPDGRIAIAKREAS
jgi:transmembrane sensor